MGKQYTLTVTEEAYTLLKKFGEGLVPTGMKRPSFSDTIKYLVAHASDKDHVREGIV